MPVDALGPLGDEHVIFPPFASKDTVPPLATVANAGDVNGDGVDDTAMLIDGSGPDYEATVWVTFSPTTLPGTMIAGAPGWFGMRIRGAHFWNAVAPLGDVNGDGLGEVVVETSDEVFVVFGRKDNATVDVTKLGDHVFGITNVDAQGATGGGGHGDGEVWDNSALASAGDQNGDGRPGPRLPRRQHREGRLHARGPRRRGGGRLEARHGRLHARDRT